MSLLYFALIFRFQKSAEFADRSDHLNLQNDAMLKDH